jgi:hypothetical protein
MTRVLARWELEVSGTMNILVVSSKEQKYIHKVSSLCGTLVACALVCQLDKMSGVEVVTFVEEIKARMATLEVGKSMGEPNIVLQLAYALLGTCASTRRLGTCLVAWASFGASWGQEAC